MEPPLKFDATATGLSLANAITCVQASACAYEYVPTLYCAETDTAVLVLELEAVTLIAFPGTRNFADCLKDLQAWRQSVVWDDHRLGIHMGFYRAFSGIGNQLLQCLVSSTKPIVLTGHSKGGALAVICAAWLHMMGKEVHSVYTFGQPRAGDKAFAAYCHAAFGLRHYRFEDASDCITRLPGWLAGNRHSGQNIFLCASGGYKVNPLLWFKIVSDTLEIYSAKQHGPMALLALGEDHHVSQYLARVSALS